VEVAGGVADGAGSDWGVDCAHPADANARANPAAVAAIVTDFKPVKLLIITPPPGKP
jgi:hypothetical protein